MDLKIKGLWRFIVFCFVGGTSALIHLIVFNIFFKLINLYYKTNIIIFGVSLSYIIGTLMGIFISIIYNFSMNRNITFAAKHEPVRKQIPKYIVVYAVSISVNFIVGILILNLLGENTLNANIATLCGILVSIPVSFIGSLLWTFRNSSK